MAFCWGNKEKFTQEMNETKMRNSVVKKYVSHNDSNVVILQFDSYDAVLNMTEKDAIEVGSAAVALFSNDEKIYVKILETTDVKKELILLNEDRWNNCTLFVHRDLYFHHNYNLLFKNQLIKLLRKTGHNVVNDFEVKDIDFSQVISEDLKSSYEDFWKESMTVFFNSPLRSSAYYLLNSEKTMLNSKLFDEDDSTHTVNGFEDNDRNLSDRLLNVDEVQYLIDSHDSVVKKYTLEDELGFSAYGFTLYSVMDEWLKNLYKIDKYKKIMLSIKDSEVAKRIDARDLSTQIFQISDRATERTIGGKNYTYIILNTVAAYGRSKNERYYAIDYFSTDEMKRRLLILSNAFGVQINFKEEIVSEIKDYDENFLNRFAEKRVNIFDNWLKESGTLVNSELKDEEFYHSLISGSVASQVQSQVDEVKETEDDTVRSQDKHRDFDNVLEELYNFSGTQKSFNNVFDKR